MRSIPKTPVAQALWLVSILAVLVMIVGFTKLGLAVMAVALAAAVVLRVLGLR